MKPELKTDVKHVSGGSLSFDEWYLLAGGLLSVLTPRLSEAGKDLTVQPFDRSVSEFVELCGQYDRAIKVRLDKLEDAKETLSKIPQGDAYKMERQHAATYCETVNNSAQKSITKRNALIDSVVALPPREFIRFTKTLQTKMIDERIAEKGQVDYVGEVLPQSKQKDIAEKANDELAAAIEERREFDAVLDEALELYDFSEECSPEYKKPMPKNHNIAAETVKALSSFRVSTSSSSLFSKPAPVKDGSFVAQAVRFAIRLGF